MGEVLSLSELPSARDRERCSGSITGKYAIMWCKSPGEIGGNYNLATGCSAPCGMPFRRGGIHITKDAIPITKGGVPLRRGTYSAPSECVGGPLGVGGMRTRSGWKAHWEWVG